MKLTLLFATILGVSTLFSQNNFFIYSTTGRQTVSVNGQKYYVDSVGTKIKTRYPKFDTLIFLIESANSGSKVICNFKPDSSYSIIYACCGSLDIIPKTKLNCDSLKYWDIDRDLEKIHNQLLDKPFLSIKTKQTTKDSIYAWHADAACQTQHKLIGTELWRLGVPSKCYYWTNVTSILFFKTDAKSQQKKNKDVGELLNLQNVIELTTINLRLFDNQKFILIYDEKSKNAILNYE